MFPIKNSIYDNIIFEEDLAKDEVYNLENIFEISQKNQDTAHRIIEDLDIINLWQSSGAKINLVGSLKMGLMMKHRDIDFHIYSKNISVSKTSEILDKLSKHPRISNIRLNDLINTEENCIECHADYKDFDNNIWQIDMIHIEEGSKYDGFFENIAERILEVLTPEIKAAILKLKYDTPDDMKIPGIEYYKAVIKDGITTFPEFLKWRRHQNNSGIIEWCP